MHDASAMTPDDAASLLAEQCVAARAASRVLAGATGAARDAGLRAAAAAIRHDAAAIGAANDLDVDGFAGTEALRDRLTLTPARIEAMAAGLEAIADLPDPLERVLAEWTRPNGLAIRRVSVPIGVIGMVFESRPHVGADAAGLALKSGNAVILRGGSESFRSTRAIGQAIEAGLAAADMPAAAVQWAPTTDRAYVAAMLAATGGIDLMIPRGGRALVQRVQKEARVPVLGHADGICHTYVHAAADADMASRLVANAKMRRTGICGATETLLIDAECAGALLPPIATALAQAGCELRGDARARAVVPAMRPAAAGDFGHEFLDAILSVAVVDGLDAALDHIRRFGSGHTDAIVTEDADAAQRFLAGTGGAVAMWNASTQFCDGGEFGFGAEIGIATGRLHARGPVGVEQLTTYRYEVRGRGQVRP